MVRPTFLGVGAQRCGTTWLFENLRRHSQVFIPNQKELNFFSDIGESSMARGLDWYLGRFNSPDGVVSGEITPEYLVDEQAPDRILKALGPDVRILAVVRDPVDRAFSAYAKGIRDGTWDCPFPEFARNNFDRCIDRGMYAAQLRRFNSRFTSVMVLVYDDLLLDPASFLRRVWDFLGVADQPTGFEHLRFNRGVAAPGAGARWLIRARDLAYRASPAFRPLSKALQRRPGMNRLADRLLAKGRGAVPQELVYDLRRTFEPDVAALSEMLERDLGALWLAE
jgi:hypothetical protein